MHRPEMLIKVASSPAPVTTQREVTNVLFLLEMYNAEMLIKFLCTGARKRAPWEATPEVSLFFMNPSDVSAKFILIVQGR